MSYIPAWKFLGALTLGAAMVFAPDPCSQSLAAQRLPVLLPYFDGLVGDDLYAGCPPREDRSGIEDWELDRSLPATDDGDYGLVPLKAAYADPADTVEMAEDFETADSYDASESWSDDEDPAADADQETADSFDRDESWDEETDGALDADQEAADQRPADDQMTIDSEPWGHPEEPAADETGLRDCGPDEEWFCRRYAALEEPSLDEDRESVEASWNESYAADGMSDEESEAALAEETQPVDRSSTPAEIDLSWRYQYWYPEEKYGADSDESEWSDDTAADDEVADGDYDEDEDASSSYMNDDGAAEQETSDVPAAEEYDWGEHAYDAEDHGDDYGYRPSPMAEKYGHYYDESMAADEAEEPYDDETALTDEELAAAAAAEAAASDEDVMEIDLTESSASWDYGHEPYSDSVTADEEYDENYGGASDSEMYQEENGFEDSSVPPWIEEYRTQGHAWDEDLPAATAEIETPRPAGLELFAANPADLLLLPDQDLVRQLNGLSLRYGEREMALNDYLESLGSEAVNFALQYASLTGKEAVSLSDDLTATVAFLAAFRLYEQGSLGLGEAVDALERTVESRPTTWVDGTISIAGTSSSNRTAELARKAQWLWNQAATGVSQTLRNARELVEKAWASTAARAATRPAVGQGTPTEKVDAAYHGEWMEESFQR